MAQTQQYFDVIKKDCSVKDTYDFSITKKSSVGHVSALSFPISGKSLKADTSLRDPENPDSPVPMVACVENVRWDGGPTDPIEISGRISPENQGGAMEALSSKKGGADIEIAFKIYSYDGVAKKYFERFSTDGKSIKGVITIGTKAFVAEDPDSHVQQPVNYQFWLSLSPKSEAGEQELVVATTASNKLTLPWGVKQGG